MNMPLIFLRDWLETVAELSALPRKSRAYRKDFASLRKTLALLDRIPRLKPWAKLQAWTLALDFLWWIAMILYALLAEAPREWILWTWLAGMCIMTVVLVLSEAKMHFAAVRWVQTAIDRIAPRIRALSDGEFENLNVLLWNDPDYMRYHPVRSRAMCGCIRCGNRFPAREIPRTSAAPRRPLCPCCGAAESWIVYSCDGVNVTSDALAQLQKLFTEEK